MIEWRREKRKFSFLISSLSIYLFITRSRQYFIRWCMMNVWNFSMNSSSFSTHILYSLTYINDFFCVCVCIPNEWMNERMNYTNDNSFFFSCFFHHSIHTHTHKEKKLWFVRHFINSSNDNILPPDLFINCKKK